ncbi:MAG: hypothetical protein LC781_17200 [Actinobacteria bacterium]|nr:hypothetical protein [Actinomycetota bacterium]
MSNRPGNDWNRTWSTWIAFITLGAVLGGVRAGLCPAELPEALITAAVTGRMEMPGAAASHGSRW